MSEPPRLGVWAVTEVAGWVHPAPRWQITRNGEPVGEPFIFKGHAVSRKMRCVDNEGFAIQEAVRAYYKKNGHTV